MWIGGIDPGRLILPLVPCANEDPLPRFFVVNDVFARPYLPKFSDTCFGIVERFYGLDEMEVSIALHLVDAKGTQPNSDLGTANCRRDSGAIITQHATTWLLF
ncbi:MAG: hypothetical protein JWO71_488 [Candidatus Acidoferrum typicum]|nr:hypothetical protein [Candidatus Acidoferrum typicum]